MTSARLPFLVVAVWALGCSTSALQPPGGDGDAGSPTVDAASPPTDAPTTTDAPTAMDAPTTTTDAPTMTTDAPTMTDAPKAMDAPVTTDAKAMDGPTTTTDASGGKPTIFYLDVAGRVMTADAENPVPRAVVSSAGQGPDGIAVDLAGGHIFWTNMGVPADDDGSLRRSNLDGSNVVTIVPAGGTYTPKQLKLDVAGGKLYWSDREGMRVQRANVDGSNLETLVTVATGATARADLSNHCVGMALDLAGGWFYWTQKGPDNGGVGSIRRAHIAMPAGQTSTNRTDIEVLFSGLPEPIDLDLDLDDRMIYWADRGDDTISRAPIELPTGRTAATRTDRQIIVRAVREAIGVAVDHRRGRLYYTGANGQLGRANLDGSNGRELTGAGAMTGIVIVDLP